MKLLLDTHVVLWWLRDDPRLGSGVRALIADTRNDAIVSVVSLWEIAIKARIGKLAERASDVAREVDASGFRTLTVEPRHVACLETLTFGADHHDPFDHLLVAQATVEAALLITSDRKMSRYEVSRPPRR